VIFVVERVQKWKTSLRLAPPTRVIGLTCWVNFVWVEMEVNSGPEQLGEVAYVESCFRVLHNSVTQEHCRESGSSLMVLTGAPPVQLREVCAEMKLPTCLTFSFLFQCLQNLSWAN